MYTLSDHFLYSRLENYTERGRTATREDFSSHTIRSEVSQRLRAARRYTVVVVEVATVGKGRRGATFSRRDYNYSFPFHSARSGVKCSRKFRHCVTIPRNSLEYPTPPFSSHFLIEPIKISDLLPRFLLSAFSHHRAFSRFSVFSRFLARSSTKSSKLLLALIHGAFCNISRCHPSFCFNIYL